MGTRWNRISKAVLTCSHNQRFEKKKKKKKKKKKRKYLAYFLSFSKPEKSLCILHGQVFIIEYQVCAACNCGKDLIYNYR